MGNSSSSAGHSGGSTGSAGSGNEQQRRPSLASRGLSHRIIGGGSNNNAHRTGLPHLSMPSSLPSPFRSGGSLGLSKAELDERCKPSGLYPTCEWETKQIRKLIGNGQLAARLKGSDVRLTKTDRECPICFMYYSESNVSKCCNAALCTECYLQIKPGKERYCICPFCNNPTMKVVVAKDMDEGDVARREEEEQLVIEATIKSRISQLHGECPGPSEPSSPGGGGEETASEGSFGSSLENYNRSRTFSNASNVSGSSNPSEHPPAPVTPLRAASSTGDESDSSALLSLAMSPDDRRALESEMRAQLSHETHRRMESEAEEARMRHAQEWYGSQQGMRSRVREARLTELTGLLERMSSRGGGGGASDNNTDGDGEGESSLLAGGDGAAGSRAGRGNGASLSRLLRAMESTSTSGGRGGGSSLEDLMRLEAAFFLGMDNDNARRPQRSGRNGRNSDADESADGDGDDNDNDEAADGLGGLAQFGRASSSPFGLGRPGSRRIVRRLGGNRGVSSTHLDTAELLMRGVSEEEQLAMAIAMSMQDSQQPQQQQNNNNEAEGEQQIETAANDAEDDDHSSSAGSSSSSGSSDGSGSDENLNEDTNAVNAEEEAGNTDGAVSLDDDEEEVVFADSAEV